MSKVISISQNLTSSTVLSIPNNAIPFTPSRFILKSVSLFGSNAVSASSNTGLYQINSSLINGDIMYLFSVNNTILSATSNVVSLTSNPDITFLLPNGANNITFTVANLNNAIVAVCFISITLEFLL